MPAIRVLDEASIPQKPAFATVSVTFRYPDRFKAQAVVREFVTALTDLNIVEARKQALRFQSIEVVSPARLPEVPASPNRLMILLATSRSEPEFSLP